MPDVALHEAGTNEETSVNTQPVATVNDVFRNTLADDIEHDDCISQLLRNIESGFYSDRQLRKLETMRQDGKTPFYKNGPVSKLEAYIMQLEFKSTHGLSDKGFDHLLGIVRKLLPEKKMSCQKRHT
jgi:hypothetical protein